MTTALQLITSAARLCQVVRKTQALAADEAMDGLESLNDMIDSWTNNSLLIPSRSWESFPITNAASYSIGPGQTLNTVRPLVIKDAFTRNNTIDYPLEILSDEQYEDIIYKSLTTNYPQYINYDNANPYGTIRLWPQVSGSGTELHLLSEKPLTTIPTLNTQVILPPGWKRAIRFNLAIDLAGEYGKDIPKEVGLVATQSLAAIELSIAKNRPVKYKAPVNTRYNIYGDTW